MQPDYMFSYVVNIVVIGPSGSGKTALIRDFADCYSTVGVPASPTSSPVTSVAISRRRLQAETNCRLSCCERIAADGGGWVEEATESRWEATHCSASTASPLARRPGNASFRSLLRWIAEDNTHTGSIEAAVETLVMNRIPVKTSPFDWVSSLPSLGRLEDADCDRCTSECLERSRKREFSDSDRNYDASTSSGDYPGNSADTSPSSAEDVKTNEALSDTRTLITRENSGSWTTALESPSCSESSGSDPEADVTLRQSSPDCDRSPQGHSSPEGGAGERVRADHPQVLRPRHSTGTQTPRGMFPSSSSDEDGEDGASCSFAPVSDNRVKVKVTDASGDWSRFLQMSVSLTPFHAVVIVYDVSDRTSFAQAVAWVLGMESNASVYRPEAITLVGNKAESKQRKVLFWEGDYLARHCGLRFIETSVVMEDCVTHAFCATTLDAINRMPPPAHQLRLRDSLPFREESSGAGTLQMSRTSRGDPRWSSPPDWGSDSVLGYCGHDSSDFDVLGPRGCCCWL